MKKFVLISSALLMCLSFKTMAQSRTDVSELSELLRTVDMSKAANQDIFFSAMSDLQKKNLLKSGLSDIITMIKSASGSTMMKGYNTEALSTQAHGLLSAELYARGYTRASYKLQSWEEISTEQLNYVRSLPKVNTFQTAAFASVFKQLSGNDLVQAQNITVYNLPSDSLEGRLALIKNARESIRLMTWGFYDDEIGRLVADELLDAHHRGIEVKIMVDGLTAARPGYNRLLTEMRNAGIEVVFWSSTENPHFGMHIKMMIVDRTKVIEGGRNIGKEYLKENEWEDMDVFYNGGCLVTTQANDLFDNAWNDQVDSGKIRYKRIRNFIKSSCSRGSFGSISHEPGAQNLDKIYALTLYAIENAQRQIKIANAYVINTPAIEEALIRAIKRGVKVSVYTNSSESIDEPIVNYPIMKSVAKLVANGATVYLKRGKTLHSKFFIADNMAWVGSYNLHPRSMKYEAEKIIVGVDSNFVAKLDGIFKASTARATEIRPKQNFVVPANAVMEKFLPMFFDQL